MTDPEAGSNDTARRAYADEATKLYRERADRTAMRLDEAERVVITATSDLRALEDERRYLELVAKLAIAGADDVTGAADGRPELAYATEDADAFTF